MHESPLWDLPFRWTWFFSKLHCFLGMQSTGTWTVVYDVRLMKCALAQSTFVFCDFETLTLRPLHGKHIVQLNYKSLYTTVRIKSTLLLLAISSNLLGNLNTNQFGYSFKYRVRNPHTPMYDCWRLRINNRIMQNTFYKSFLFVLNRSL